jgi:hypothetical protein
MLNFELHHEESILVLHPEGPLEATDFTMLASQIDAYLEGHEKLRGVLIRAKSFPGWKNFDALLAQVKFVKEHHREIEKVAVVANGTFANIMPSIASRFIHAQIKHFEPDREDDAWNWLREDNSTSRSQAAAHDRNVSRPL